MSLKPCPCGQTPNRVLIQAEHARPKFAYCGGDCCEDWRIEFRNNYKDVGGRESNALAEAAWNAAPRGVSQREALVAYADDPVPAQPVAPVAQVPEGVVLAFGLLWHVRMGCDFHVPAGFSMNISPEEAAAKARRFLSDLLTREQRGDGINRAADMLAASTTAERDPYASHSHDEAIAAAHADGKIKFTPPGPITGVWIDEATEPSKEGE